MLGMLGRWRKGGAAMAALPTGSGHLYLGKVSFNIIEAQFAGDQFG